MSRMLALVVCLLLALPGCDSGSGAGGGDLVTVEDVAAADACIPACQEKGCGPDGCGGSCGECSTSEACSDSGACMCLPQCAEERPCGPDGCGGVCGTCAPGDPCIQGQCDCVPELNCVGKECGPDGCGGTCGTCEEGECIPGTGMCGPAPVADCVGKECGSDGAGGSCGICPCETCDADEVFCNTVTFQCGMEPEGDCKWIFDCFDTCPEGDQACAQNCVNEASLPAQMAYDNLIQCLSDSGYFDCFDQFPEGSKEQASCLEAAFEPCLDYYGECFLGTLTCQEMDACFLACPEVAEGKPNPCISDCWSSGTVQAQKTYTAILDCLEAHGYWDCAPGDSKCLSDAEAACQAEFDACFPPGTLTCKEILDCMDACPVTDQACFSSCYQSGTKEAQALFAEIVDCIIAECGEQATPECEDAALKGTCSEQYSECLGT